MLDLFALFYEALVSDRCNQPLLQIIKSSRFPGAHHRLYYSTVRSSEINQSFANLKICLNMGKIVKS